MSLQRVSRAERFLENAVSFGQLTPSGRDFLIAAIDPFHDTQLKELQGWPDLETSSSVVRLIKQTLSIKAPPSVGTGDWDLYLDLWPWMNNTLFWNSAYGTGTRVNNNINVDTNGPNVALGGLTAFAVPAGTTVDYADPNLRIDSLTLPDTYTRGPNRVVGVGFEAVNTTAAIYRQGQAMVYRQSNPAKVGQHISLRYGAPPAAALADETANFYPCPPQNAAQTMLIPGTRQWAAEEGCYVVGTFVGQDNPPTTVNYNQVAVFAKSSGADSAIGATSNPVTLPVNSDPVLYALPVSYTAAGVVSSQPIMQVPIHTAGARFLGLSPTSSFSITLNVYVETFPTVAESDILVLATPSAQYDPVALEIFSHALSKLPVGVMVCENNMGDFFSDAIATATQYLAPIMKDLGYNGVSRAMGTANRMAREYRNVNGYDVPPNAKTRKKPPAQIKPAKKPPPPPPKPKHLQGKKIGAGRK